MNFQLAHEWLRELEREIEEAAAERDREFERKLAAATPGTMIRICLPEDENIQRISNAARR